MGVHTHILNASDQYPDQWVDNPGVGGLPTITPTSELMRTYSSTQLLIHAYVPLRLIFDRHKEENSGGLD